MNKYGYILVCFAMAALLAAACVQSGVEGAEVLEYFPVDDLENVLAGKDAAIDEEFSFDGSGSLRIDAAETKTVRIFDVKNIDIEKAKLIYSATVKTENLDGKAYLEMWCRFPGKGEFFSRGLNSTLSGNSDWTRLETVFFLKKGQNPDLVKLNLVVEGKGTVWIDDVKLYKGEL